MLVRVSYGTAIAMGLIRAKLLARPTTAYLMTYWPGKCANDCAFCAQARSSKADLAKLSRVTWPAFELEKVVQALPNGRFGRICLQTIDYPGMLDDVLALLRALKPLSLPVSVSITPVDNATLEEFKGLGVDYVGVGLDVASERLFGEIKPDFEWDEMWGFAERIVEVLGPGKALIHVIVGLGETDRELVEVFERAYSIGADVSLFAFTPLKGTRLENLEPPSVERYRKVQLARWLIERDLGDRILFEGESIAGFDLEDIEVPPAVFATHGCPACNRPYYNERPGGELYNFPFPPEERYVKKIISALQGER
ncbi:radical SAM protein [Thermococcus gammatolerans]|uniref:Biotin synthase related protein n=1 Tax=Thermococcus gammatolerans (strain DSM 15229 / JCM 11827 / EJ3) TaxID=593117 RepID=C5A6Q2_THEGJ|nr:radical SAM protein [Thermococcus gammatolerans]ACS33914.1 Biotin synthase related protein [Thermococcus gammatolerans EJ3]